MGRYVIVHLLWSSWSGFLVLDIKHRSCVIKLHTLGFPVGLQHAWRLLLMLFCQSWGIHISIVPVVHIMARVSGVTETSCLLIIVQESRDAPWQLAPVGLRGRSLVGLKALAVKRETRGCPSEVPLWKEKGRLSRKWRLLMRILY